MSSSACNVRRRPLLCTRIQGDLAEPPRSAFIRTHAFTTLHLGPARDQQSPELRSCRLQKAQAVRALGSASNRAVWGQAASARACQSI